VKDQRENIYTRLVLVNDEKQKAYDADFGFKFNAVRLERRSFNEQSFFCPTTQALPIYTLRNKHSTDLAGNVSFDIPFFQCETPIPNLQWYFCQGMNSFLFGLAMSKANITSLSIEYVSYLPDVSLLDNPNFEESFLEVDKPILFLEINNGQKIIYLDFQKEFENQIWGKHLKKDCNYGNVYKGVELCLVSSKATTVPSSSSASSLYNSSSSRNNTSSSSSSFAATLPFNSSSSLSFYCFDSLNFHYVVIKIASFDDPLHSLPTNDPQHPFPAELSDLRNSLTKTCEKENVINEIEVMEFLNQQQSYHNSLYNASMEEDGFIFPSFPQLLNVQVDNYNLYAISSYYGGGNVYEFMISQCKYRKLEEYQLKYLFKQILLTFSFLHSCGISHLDISPENIMLDHPCLPENIIGIKCILIDFGLTVRQCYHSQEGRFGLLAPRGGNNAGKACFHCPELIPYVSVASYYHGNQDYNPMKVDVWQLGILLYILLTGAKPFSTPETTIPNRQPPAATSTNNAANTPRKTNEDQNNNNKNESTPDNNGTNSSTKNSPNNNDNNNHSNNKTAEERIMDQFRAFHEWIKFLHQFSVHQKPVRWYQADGRPVVKYMKDVFSTTVLNLLNQLLAVNPEERPDLETILNNPWLNINDDL
jgi:serine/threonine protein kinase